MKTKRESRVTTRGKVEDRLMVSGAQTCKRNDIFGVPPSRGTGTGTGTGSM